MSTRCGGQCVCVLHVELCIKVFVGCRLCMCHVYMDVCDIGYFLKASISDVIFMTFPFKDIVCRYDECKVYCLDVVKGGRQKLYSVHMCLCLCRWRQLVMHTWWLPVFQIVTGTGMRQRYPTCLSTSFIPSARSEWSICLMLRSRSALACTQVPHQTAFCTIWPHIRQLNELSLRLWIRVQRVTYSVMTQSFKPRVFHFDIETGIIWCSAIYSTAGCNQVGWKCWVIVGRF